MVEMQGKTGKCFLQCFNRNDYSRCNYRKTRYINLGVSTKAEHWDFEKNQPKSTCPNRELLEKLIANKISEVKNKIVELKSEDKEYSATTLVEKVSNLNKTITVGELFKRHIHCLEEENYLSNRPIIH